MEPSPEFVALLYAEEVARARAMSPAEKLLEGPRLFERACRVVAAGIRHRQPELDEEGVQAKLRAYLVRVDHVERGGTTFDTGVGNTGRWTCSTRSPAGILHERR